MLGTPSVGVNVGEIIDGDGVPFGLLVDIVEIAEGTGVKVGEEVVTAGLKTVG
jgi:hypothetical protein